MLVKQQLSAMAMAGVLAMAALWWTMGRSGLHGQPDTGFQGGPVTESERGNQRSTVDAPADGIALGDLGLGPPPPAAAGNQSLCAPILGDHYHRLLLFNRILARSAVAASSFTSARSVPGANHTMSRMR